ASLHGAGCRIARTASRQLLCRLKISLASLEDSDVCCASDHLHNLTRGQVNSLLFCWSRRGNLPFWLWWLLARFEYTVVAALLAPVGNDGLRHPAAGVFGLNECPDVGSIARLVLWRCVDSLARDNRLLPGGL